MKIIDGEKLYKDIINIPSKLENKGPFYQAGSVDRQNEILDLIKNALAVDAEPVVHAHYYKNSGLTLFPICSNCHMINAAKHNYCENCGSKMDEDEEA